MPTKIYQTERATDAATATTMAYRGEFAVLYEIENSPYNETLSVSVVLRGITATQTHGPTSIVLTIGQPSVGGVDFEVRSTVIK